MPKPVFCAMPTQPDHASAAAGTARTSSGQDRMVPDRPGSVRGEVRIRDRRRSGTEAAGSAISAGSGLRHGEVGQRCHAAPPSGSARGCGSPVSAARAAATSASVARTYVDVAPARSAIRPEASMRPIP
jgi:hypothetical protein